jgi:hypothetical protein
MKNLLKVSLVAAAFILAAGCSSQPKPAPVQPTVTETPVETPAPVVKKCKKGKKHCKKVIADKLGQTSYEKDTTK